MSRSHSAPPFDRVLEALGERVVHRGEKEATCRCPAHEDVNPSLSVTAGDDGKVLLKCHAGCSVESICSALGLKVRDLFQSKKRPPSEIETTHDYVDESGALLFQVVRFRPKSFRQRRPDGRGGWVWNLKGVRRVLYRLPDLIAADKAETVYIAEGEKDVDSLRELGLEATCNPGGAKKWRQDYAKFLTDRSVVILSDNDTAGLEHAQRIAERLLGAAKSVKIVLLEGLAEKGDVTDWIGGLRSRNVDNEEIKRQLVEVVHQAPEWRPIDPDNGELEDDDPRTIRIDVTDKDLQKLTERAIEAILSANEPPQVFSRGTAPVRIIRNDDGASEIQDVDSARMRFHLARIARWTEVVKDVRRSVFPPDAVVANVLACPNIELPVLNRIVTTPLFAADGTIVSERGYSPNGRVYFEPDGLDLAKIRVPERPTAQEVAEAKALIIDELLSDFPFDGPADRANAVGLYLLPFVREMIPSPTPLHLIEKPSPGTGATLLVDCFATVTTGRSATVLTEGGDEGEWRKRITAALRTGPSFIFIDNLSRKLDSGSLSAAITSTYWNDRILGKSVILNLPVRCVWVATGNDPRTSTELARRCAPIRMDARLDRPWDRDVEAFRHPNLRKWVREHRADLIRAALLLVQHWVASGRPREEGVTLGGFEDWALVIGGILGTAEIPGFLDNLKTFYGRADQELEAWERFFEAWWSTFPDRAIGVADLFKVIVGQDLALDLGRGSERSQRTRLGILLKRFDNRRCGPFLVSPQRTVRGAARWCLSRRDGEPSERREPLPTRLSEVENREESSAEENSRSLEGDGGGSQGTRGSHGHRSSPLDHTSDQGDAGWEEVVL